MSVYFVNVGMKSVFQYVCGLCDLETDRFVSKMKKCAQFWYKKHDFLKFVVH